MLYFILFFFFFFFFNDPATTEIYTLSLHDALPTCCTNSGVWVRSHRRTPPSWPAADRKSTRLNSSHVRISYAVFCLKKKKHYSVGVDNAEKNINASNMCESMEKY